MQSPVEPCEMSNEEKAIEAEKLFKYAKSKIAKGNLAGAEKCLLRAERLHPTHRAKKLLNQIQNKVKSNGNTKTNASDMQGEQRSNENLDPNTSCTSEQIPRQRTTSNKSFELEYTKKQLDAVRRIFKSQNHYEVLNVEADASDAEIKDAYKKLALQVHPDKNKAPRANQAFQMLGNAKDVLSHPEKRKKYDMELQQQRQYMDVDTMCAGGSFDIPTWMVVGGIAIFAAGIFGVWWNKRQEKQKQEQSRQDEEEMSQN